MYGCCTVSFTVVEDVLGLVGNAKVFSKIDLETAYLQLPLDENSKNYTTINTCEGLYRYNYLPFGISSSPGIFQSFISRVLANVNNVIIYQDDILIMTANKSEHDVVLDNVLNTLYKAGIKIKLSKCSFYTDSVQYLGHVFSSDGVRPNAEKLSAIIDAPTPTTVKQVQSFVGLCTFYSRFINRFSDVMAPFYSLLRKDSKFVWGTEQINNFKYIKNVFKSDKVLKLFDSKLETSIETDASSYGIAAVLMQKHIDGWHPVQFASRTLHASEVNYSQIEREALSVLFGCERFRQFLLGTKFVIKNDHKPLLKLLNSNSGLNTNCSARLQRWKLRLSQFNYEFCYIKGEDNVNSDFFSRHPLKDNVDHMEPYELIFVIDSLQETPVTFNDIVKFTNADKNLCKLKQYIKFGFPNEVDTEISCFKGFDSELSIMKDCIMFRNRVLIPEKLRKRVLVMFHEGHPGIVRMKSVCRSLIWYPGIDEDINNIVKSCKQCISVRAKPPQNSTVSWPEPYKKWSRIHIDHFFFQNVVLLIVIDAYTKYIECEVVSSINSAVTIETLRSIFSRNGLPDTLVSDNALSFKSFEFKQFLLDNGIEHMTPPPYCPYGNGQVERAVRTFKDLLKKNSNVGNFQFRLSNALLYYRNTPCTVTNVAPSIALNGRVYVTVKEKINPHFVPNVSKNKNIIVFNIGDNVLALNCQSGPKWYNARIVEKIAVNMYNVYVNELDTTWRRHAQQLLPFTTNIPTLSNDCTSNVNRGNVINSSLSPANNHDNPKDAGVINDEKSNSDIEEKAIPSVTDFSDNTKKDFSDSSIVVPVVDNNDCTVETLNTDHVLRRSTRITKPIERFIPGTKK